MVRFWVWCCRLHSCTHHLPLWTHSWLQHHPKCSWYIWPLQAGHRLTPSQLVSQGIEDSHKLHQGNLSCQEQGEESRGTGSVRHSACWRGYQGIPRTGWYCRYVQLNLSFVHALITYVLFQAFVLPKFTRYSPFLNNLVPIASPSHALNGSRHWAPPKLVLACTSSNAWLATPAKMLQLSLWIDWYGDAI